MSGNNAAGVPPTGGSNALATGAAAGVAGLAAAPDAGAAGGEDESSGEESAPKPVAPPRMRIAASPGMDEGTDVRIKLANNMYGKGVVSGERNFDGTYPVAGLMDNGQQTPRGLQLEPRAATVTAGWPARTTPALSPLRYRIVKVGRDEVLGPDFTQ